MVVYIWYFNQQGDSVFLWWLKTNHFAAVQNYKAIYMKVRASNANGLEKSYLQMVLWLMPVGIVAELCVVLLPTTSSAKRENPYYSVMNIDPNYDKKQRRRRQQSILYNFLGVYFLLKAPICARVCDDIIWSLLHYYNSSVNFSLLFFVATFERTDKIDGVTYAFLPLTSNLHTGFVVVDN